MIALYGGFEPNSIDTLSLIDLGEHLGRLTVRDLRQLETRVPLDTLQTVLNLALEIGREGREGKPVGTLFVVGDTQKVRKMSRSASFDPVKGYSRKERNLKSARVREGIKEIAQMDGAILVAPMEPWKPRPNTSMPRPPTSRSPKVSVRGTGPRRRSAGRPVPWPSP